MHDETTVPSVLLGFAVPLQLLSSVFAFLGRDALAVTGFGMFTGTWLGYGLAGLSSSPAQTSHVLGVSFLATGGIFIMLTGAGLAGGRAAAGVVILVGSARFIISGLYELTGSMGLEHAAGLVGLVFVGVEHEAGVREQL